MSTLPGFYPRLLPGVDAGIGHAQCSVRGGGELGDAWRLAGKGATKPNSWRDAIACAKKLIADGYTTAGQLAIMGTSAGGITAGRAATERPELFAAAISAVGVSNPLRSEQSGTPKRLTSTHSSSASQVLLGGNRLDDPLSAIHRGVIAFEKRTSVHGALLPELAVE